MRGRTMKSVQGIMSLAALVVLIVAQGCGVDPLVCDENGTLRSSITLAEVEEAELPSCDCLDAELLESELLEWTVIPVRDADDIAVIVANGQAVCIDGVDDGPTPEPSIPEGDRRISTGPTPEPSNPTGENGLSSGPTPEPSTWSQMFSQRPTPEPSKDFPVTTSSQRPNTGPTPEPSIQ